MSRARVERCPAKINLHLEVGAKRRDGYHAVHTLLQSLDLADGVSIRPDGTGCEPGLEITGPFAEGVPSGPANLALQAARLFAEATGKTEALRLRMELRKEIPHGAGLGGGSSDAAGTLRLLRRRFHPDLPGQALEEMALRLGSDVPFLLRGGTAEARGRGEELRFLPPLPPRGVLLAWPGTPLSTERVYAHHDRLTAQRKSLTPSEAPPTLDFILKLLRDARPAPIRNDLERAAKDLVPEIAAVLEELEGLEPLGSAVTGSGSCCFALFADRAAAEAAAGRFRSSGIRVLATECRPGGRL